MEPDFSKAAFKNYLDLASAKNLVNSNTVNGWKAAAAKLLEDEADTVDVRSVDIKTAIRRYNNGHPGVLSPASLAAYEKRLAIAIEEFAKFQSDPAAYKGRGRNPTAAAGTSKKVEVKLAPEGAKLQASSSSVVGVVGAVSPGLPLSFPMRPDFLAQVVVPRDMTSNEARRLAHFIMTLAQDFNPPAGAG